MKAFSYTCPAEEIKEIRDILVGMGATALSQAAILDIETGGIPISLIRIVFILDEETEIVFKLAFPPGTFKDCSA